MFRIAFLNQGYTFPEETLQLRVRRVNNRIFLQMSSDCVFEIENTYANSLLIDKFILTMRSNKNKTDHRLSVFCGGTAPTYVMTGVPLS